MVYLVTLSSCNLNQWSMDFDGNLRSISESIRQAKKAGARFRTGPELEITGYGCEDHFFENDTIRHTWESITAILNSDLTDGQLLIAPERYEMKENMLVDIGAPVLHAGVRYNCRIFILNRQILLIRPKLYLANEGNYRELRWFTPWPIDAQLQSHPLPLSLIRPPISHPPTVPFGYGYLQLLDTSIACESCEELFTPISPHIEASLLGVDIIANGSGSHHNLRKLNARLSLIMNASKKCGGVYLYANQQGCDGGRLYYDGCASIVKNGDLLVQGKQFSVTDIEVVTASIDLEEIQTYRAAVSSRNMQAASQAGKEKVNLSSVSVNWCLGDKNSSVGVSTAAIQAYYHRVEEEIALGPACWLWDYLRRSGAAGFFLPLSGGADSAATAAIVGSMCHLIHRACLEGDHQVLADVTRLLHLQPLPSPLPPPPSLPQTFPNPFTPAVIAYHIFHTAYLASAESGTETRDRAASISKEIGAYHLMVNMSSVITSIVNLLSSIFSRPIKFRSQGGTTAENLALQNVSARLRMLLSYSLASLLPWYRGEKGFLLVLGSSNVDEGLRGYLTKYDCSSADINPIGGICKSDLKQFLLFAADQYHYPSLTDVVQATPTAELEPSTNDYVQSDEVDMGMTYSELTQYGRLRQIQRCGPVSMYEALRHTWRQSASLPGLSLSTIAKNYSPEDHRFDHRQFLYNPRWERQNRVLDDLVSVEERAEKESELRAELRETEASLKDEERLGNGSLEENK